ncbi:Sensor histidine kinase YycG [compost metagenome]
MLELKVKDQGRGIPEADLKRVFEKFYRGKVTNHIPGTGLGLAICKSIVEAHGGSIAAESNLNQGTVIVMKLPVESAEGRGRSE